MNIQKQYTDALLHVKDAKFIMEEADKALDSYWANDGDFDESDEGRLIDELDNAEINYHHAELQLMTIKRQMVLTRKKRIRIFRLKNKCKTE